MVGIDIEVRAAVLDLKVVDARKLVKADRRPLGLDRDRSTGQVPHLAEGARLDSTAQPDDADSITESLHLREDVAGQKHGAAFVMELSDALAERQLHQRI